MSGGNAAQWLCSLDMLSSPGSASFPVQGPGGPDEIFLIRRDQRITAWLNRCPHAGSPLDWLPGQFLDLEQRYIQCATHDARFHPEDGRCVSGPCVGQFLQAVEVALRDDGVWLTDPRYRLLPGDGDGAP